MQTDAAAMTIQSAAIPYRVDSAGEISVLLVTSRTRRRWILPKGKVGTRMLARRSAEREAFEEAGVIGRVGKEPVGTYEQISPGNAQPGGKITVQAFALEVVDELSMWQEMHQRERRWFAMQAALRAVRDPELRKLLLLFRTYVQNHHRR